VDTSPTAVAAAAAAAAAAGTDTGAAATRGGHLPTSTLSLNANGVAPAPQRRPTPGRGMDRGEAAGGQYTMTRDGLQATTLSLPPPAPQQQTLNPVRMVNTNPLAPRPRPTINASNIDVIEDGTAALLASIT
jgi:hypothetical protein